MNSRTRRRALLLATATAATAGLLGTSVPTAAAADAAPGRIALGGETGVSLATLDGPEAGTFPGLRNPGTANPAWAPDGSRVAVADGTVFSSHVSYDASPLVMPLGGADATSVTYWQDGAFYLFTQAGRLWYSASDGTWSEPARLLTDAQEPSNVQDSDPSVTSDGRVFFTRHAGSTDSVQVFDPAAGTVTKVLDDAADPAVLEDGSRLAFTRPDGSGRSVHTADADGGNVQLVHRNVLDDYAPAWDPSGRYLVHTSDGEGSTHDVVSHDLSTGESKTITSTTGTNSYQASWQPLRRNSITRVRASGSTTLDQAASKWTFDTNGSHVEGLVRARSAVLTDKAAPTYAATGITLAPNKQGPLLHTSAGTLDPGAAAELKRILAPGSTVYLNGNTTRLSAAVADQVEALGFHPLRMDAPNLGALSVRVAKQIGTPSWVFLVDGVDYHDEYATAAAAGALGYRGTGVVLTTTDGKMPTEVQNYLNSLQASGTNLVTVGSRAQKALLDSSLDQEWSYYPLVATSFETTAVALAKFWWTSPYWSTVNDIGSSANSAPGTAATATYGPVLWGDRTQLSAATEVYLRGTSASMWGVQTFGDATSYPQPVITSLVKAIGAGPEWTTAIDAPGGALPPAAPAARSLGTGGTASAPVRPQDLESTHAAPGTYVPAPVGRTRD
ncbi:hypothetical protein [uncultured Streptomyces sp.]|uniref:hypothetical protein n=1 Tax=uncultured Streptomyces sp. TaxID=174707 RepID=UPI00260C9520|nr:hypothetical protein [uncultured Streptomyces sp.]